MGADFIRDRAAKFRKAWDDSLRRLGTPDLFTQQPTNCPRVWDADIVGNAKIQPGENLVVRKFGDRLVAMRGLSEVAQLKVSNIELLDAMDRSFGVAKGIVEQVHDDAGVVEIAVC